MLTTLISTCSAIVEVNILLSAAIAFCALPIIAIYGIYTIVKSIKK